MFHYSFMRFSVFMFALTALIVNNAYADAESDLVSCQSTQREIFIKCGNEQRCGNQFSAADIICSRRFHESNQFERKSTGNIPQLTASNQSVAIPAQVGVFPFTDYLGANCMKFVQIEKNELNQMIRDLTDTPYLIDDYFRIASCKPEKSGGVKSPLLHLVAEAPCSRVEYPEIIHRYFSVKRQTPQIWLEVVNAKNSIGETFLDYMESLNTQNDFNTSTTQSCANRLIAFACKTGGTYAKVINRTCPAS